MEQNSDLRYDTYPALFMNASAAIADSPLRQRLTAGVLAPQSFDVLFQVRLGPSRLCLGVPIAGTPVAPFFMQRVEHAMGPTPGDCRVPVALPIMRARTGKDFPRDDAREHSLPMLRTPR